MMMMMMMVSDQESRLLSIAFNGFCVVLNDHVMGLMSGLRRMRI